MPDMPWKEAIEKVLADEGAALHYTEIAELIAATGLREAVGATPAATVNATISTSLKAEGENSPFRRVSRGEYMLREIESSTEAEDTAEEPEEAVASQDPIMALGMFWERDLVKWTSRPAILGRQQIGADAVNMADQLGVYLLHDVREVVYVGRSTERPLGVRLYEHTFDRLKTRWNRFSWFGLRPVTEDGSLVDIAEAYAVSNVATAMEALLIEALEPPQNRRRGDGFSGVEYIQAEDPEMERAQMRALMEELQRRL